MLSKCQSPGIRWGAVFWHNCLPVSQIQLREKLYHLNVKHSAAGLPHSFWSAFWRWTVTIFGWWTRWGTACSWLNVRYSLHSAWVCMCARVPNQGNPNRPANFMHYAAFRQGSLHLPGGRQPSVSQRLARMYPLPIPILHARWHTGTAPICDHPRFHRCAWQAWLRIILQNLQE